MRETGRWGTAFALLLLALALAVTGCGDDDDPEETVKVQETATTEETATAVVTDTLPEEKAASAAGGATRIGPHYFQTPSGNIGCYLDQRAARCDIRKRSWKPTPPPEPCELDYGQGIAVGADHAEFVCAGDTTLGGPSTLGYGQVARRGDFRCRSGRKGVTCSHAANGHGFFLSRESYRIF
jgi:hypothetical protein